MCECLCAVNIGLIVVAWMACGGVDAKTVASWAPPRRVGALVVREIGGPQKHRHVHPLLITNCHSLQTATAASQHGHGVAVRVCGDSRFCITVIREAPFAHASQTLRKLSQTLDPIGTNSILNKRGLVFRVVTANINERRRVYVPTTVI